ncbi:hypothetical protein L2E82_11313 [Cichorium intybus]|uniref:Uncharacterized protein n=1 Tax=Cichorium intybus TaxID=13427 RepID=A0ACB9GCR7_CICIN|nr:hypothetical protein L2E82_11313 [Cichorium intybus]
MLCVLVCALHLLQYVQISSLSLSRVRLGSGIGYVFIPVTLISSSVYLQAQSDGVSYLFQGLLRKEWPLLLLVHSSLLVVGVPVTLNGDLNKQFVQPNVGFDTICKVNSQLISNVCTDALSAEKVILSEEVAASKLTIFDLTEQIRDAVQARAEEGAFSSFVLSIL